MCLGFSTQEKGERNDTQHGKMILVDTNIGNKISGNTDARIKCANN